MTADGLAFGLTNWLFGFGTPPGVFAPIPRFGGPRFDEGLRDLGRAAGLTLSLVPGEPVRPVCVE
jgi:hypothetical protein